MKRLLMEFLIDHILDLETIDIKVCERYRNQIARELEAGTNLPISKPAVFIAFQTLNVMNYSYGAKQTELQITLHFVVDDITGEKLDSYDIVDLVDAGIQGLSNQGDGVTSPSFGSIIEDSMASDELATMVDHPVKVYRSMIQENHAVRSMEEGSIATLQFTPERGDFVDQISSDHE